jgi:hypothetical protein
MEQKKQLTFYITKVKASNGVTNFRIKTNFANSQTRIVEGLPSGVWVIEDENEEGGNKLKEEFQSFLKEMLGKFELKKEDDRVEFTMKFGDEYSTWCSVGIRIISEEKDLAYMLNCPEITIPLNEKEIEFFWKCLHHLIVI